MPNMTKLNVAAYTYNEDGSEKSLIVYGNTVAFANQLKTFFHGSYKTASRLNYPIPSGVSSVWIISAKHRKEIEKFISNPDGYKPSRRYKYKAKKKTKITAKPRVFANNFSPEQLLSSLGLSKAEIISYLINN